MSRIYPFLSVNSKKPRSGFLEFTKGFEPVYQFVKRFSLRDGVIQEGRIVNSSLLVRTKADAFVKHKLKSFDKSAGLPTTTKYTYLKFLKNPLAARRIWTNKFEEKRSVHTVREHFPRIFRFKDVRRQRVTERS